MTDDSEVIRAIEAAVNAVGQFVSLSPPRRTVHQRGPPRGRLWQIEAVLHDTPDHLEGLGLAVRAGNAVGDPRAPD